MRLPAETEALLAEVDHWLAAILAPILPRRRPLPILLLSPGPDAPLAWLLRGQQFRPQDHPWWPVPSRVRQHA